jgi:hypothetical protein
MKRLARDINSGSVPVILPFLLAEDLGPSTGGLVLPFVLPEPVAVSSITRVDSTATATVVGHGFVGGERVNIRGATQPEYNGDFAILVLTDDTFSFEVVGFPATPASGTITLCQGNVVFNEYLDMVRSGSTVTVTVVGHGFATGKQVNIRGAEQAEYNGDFDITVLDEDRFTFDIASGNPLSPASGVVLINGGPVVRNSYGGGIFAAGVFSSPVSDVTGNGKEYIVLVGADAVYLYREGEAIVEMAFPSGQTVEADDDVTVVQAFDQLFVLRSKALAGEWVPQAVTDLTRSGTTATALVLMGRTRSETSMRISLPRVCWFTSLSNDHTHRHNNRHGVHRAGGVRLYAGRHDPVMAWQGP